MARPPSKRPTELELEILKAIWPSPPMSVRQVRDALSPRRELAYTSVMTIMNIMVDKGYLARRKVGASFAYKPRAAQRDTTRRILGDLVDRLFGGSTAAVVVNLLESADLDKKEIEVLRDLLNRKSKETGQ